MSPRQEPKMSATNTTETTTDLLARALAAGWRDEQLRADGWMVGTTSGSGIDGVVLSVHTPWVNGSMATCPECHGRSFPAGTDRPFCEAMDAARDAAYGMAEAHGHLVRYSTTEAGRRSMVKAIERAAARGVR
jgi:hypothetical protein